MNGVKWAVVLGLFWCLLEVRRAWAGPRFCPRVPLLKGLPHLPFEAELHSLLLLILFCIALTPQPTWAVLAWLAVVGVSCLYDYTRLLPWFYQYSFMLLGLVSLPEAEALNLCRLINLSIYFWSGLLKANRYFIQKGFAGLVAPLLKNLPPGWHPPILWLGVAAPVVEGGLGLGLLFPSTRNLSVVLALAMHGFILLCFSGLGKTTHRTIWPWNISMGCLTVMLFAGETEPWQRIIWGGSPFHALVLGLFTLLPILGLFNCLDCNFSHGYMSGRHVLGYLHMTTRFRARLPASIQSECLDNGPGFYVLDLGNWYVKELAMNPPQVHSMLITIARDFERYEPGFNDFSLTITGMPGFFSEDLPRQQVAWLQLFPEKRSPKRRHLKGLRARDITGK